MNGWRLSLDGALRSWDHLEFLKLHHELALLAVAQRNFDVGPSRNTSCNALSTPSLLPRLEIVVGEIPVG